MRTITPTEFSSFQKLIHDESGIFLSEAKKALLVGRLAKRLRLLGLDSFSKYYELVAHGNDPDELVRMIDCISTNETRFFREPAHFQLLADRIAPEWEAAAAAGKREKRIRIWSAACSSGEEPYSIAMLLLDRLPESNGWEIEILATDISTRVLDQARDGIWPVERSRDIPPHLLKGYMLKGKRSEEGRMAAGPELRSRISFLRMNLTEERYPIHGTFDAVFCRNVLIYFDAETKRMVIRKMIEHLVPGGYLFLGHAEGLTTMDPRARRVAPNVYAAENVRADRLGSGCPG